MNVRLTYSAPPERASAADVAADYQKLLQEPLVQQLLDSFPEPAMILNPQRQVVLANDKLAALLNAEPEQLLGRRPGEILNCIHSQDCDGGCGTSKFCAKCGAAGAIWESQKTNTAQVQECRMTCATEQGSASLDLKVWATPLAVSGRFTILAVRDISDEKRRGVLERLFFHDVLNIAGGLKGILDIWPDLEERLQPEMHQTMRNLAEELLEEIRSHRDLVAAERGDLEPVFKEIDAEQLLMQLCGLYGHHTVAMGKTLAPPTFSGPRVIRSDGALLSRVLGNLIKNALEASSRGQTVEVSFENSGTPVFSVHNESAMPASVQLQVFQRSFSTKEGSGRGIGTYSVKLLTERYLKGTVAFTSSATHGTTFTVTLNGA